jgi:hypothetical protein
VILQAADGVAGVEYVRCQPAPRRGIRGIPDIFGHCLDRCGRCSVFMDHCHGHMPIYDTPLEAYGLVKASHDAMQREATGQGRVPVARLDPAGLRLPDDLTERSLRRHGPPE